MPQKGKNGVDRLPFICTAGIASEHCESVSEILKEYPKSELAEKWVKAKQNKLVGHGEPATPVIPEYNQVKDILGPDLNKSRFLEFKDRFYENLYCKKVPLGKATPANSKPDHITNESVTFGRVNENSERLYEIALPKKSPDQVLAEYIRWHDKYKLSHGDYYPSEQKVRGYNKNFDPKRMYGSVVNADTTGAKLKAVLHSSVGNRSFIIGKTQDDFLKHNKSLLGKALKRIDLNLPPDKVHGRISIADECDVKRLLNSNVTPEEISKFANVTTYRAFSDDLYNSPLDCRKPAGVLESKYPFKTAVKFDTENLGEETTAKQLISPSIPTHFGLSHRDFLVPRPKDEIHRIFTKVGYDLKDDEYFEKLWQFALKQWTSLGDEVSIEAFKFALQEIPNDGK